MQDVNSADQNNYWRRRGEKSTSRNRGSSRHRRIVLHNNSIIKETVGSFFKTYRFMDVVIISNDRARIIEGIMYNWTRLIKRTSSTTNYYYFSRMYRQIRHVRTFSDMYTAIWHHVIAFEMRTNRFSRSSQILFRAYIRAFHTSVIAPDQ